MESGLSFRLRLMAVFLAASGILSFHTCASAAETSTRLRVYFMTGGPVDVFSHDTASTIKRKVDEYAKNLKFDVVYKRHWFARWRHVSKEIRNLKKGEKVVLIGHSWGGAGVVQCAQDLSKTSTPVDLLVTIDTTPVPGFAFRGITANVKVNYNFFQTSDLFAHSSHNNHRVSESAAQSERADDSIHNIQVLVGATLSPHLRVDNKVAPLVAYQIGLLMLDKLDELHIPDRMDKEMIGNVSVHLDGITR